MITYGIVQKTKHFVPSIELLKKNQIMMPGWGMQGMMGGGGGFAPRRFEEQYHVYSVAYADKAHLEVRSNPNQQIGNQIWDCFIFFLVLFSCFSYLLLVVVVV